VPFPLNAHHRLNELMRSSSTILAPSSSSTVCLLGLLSSSILLSHLCFDSSSDAERFATLWSYLWFCYPPVAERWLLLVPFVCFTICRMSSDSLFFVCRMYAFVIQETSLVCAYVRLTIRQMLRDGSCLRICMVYDPQGVVGDMKHRGIVI
jgi:hypothetical protein